MRDFRVTKGWELFGTNSTSFAGVMNKQERSIKDSKAERMIRAVNPIVIIKKDKKKDVNND